VLIISPTARVSPLADIEDSVRGTKIIIGDRVTIDAFVKMKPAGGLGDISIGAGSYINSGCVLYCGNGISIGQNVLIAANCTLAASNHDYRRRDTLIVNQGFLSSRGGIFIESDVWIGANCVLLDGAVLREGCVIGAGSVVRTEVPSYTIWAGSPLKEIGKRQ
jgi:acetyltransferase-like isoleucine patch superfamily enzyme